MSKKSFKDDIRRNDKYRSRVFDLLLYDDSPEWEVTLSLVFAEKNWCAIYHDKDISEGGSPKKPHYHCVVKFDNALWNTAVAKRFEMPLQFVGEKVITVDGALSYMVHFNDIDKYQYDVDDVKYSSDYMRSCFLKSINKEDDTEENKVLKIIELIKELDHYATYTEVTKLVCVNDCYSAFRRSNYLFCKIIDEHNMELRRNENDL